MNLRLSAYLPAVRKIAVAIAGFSVLLLGVALIVLPGPAVVVVPLGLAILARQFPWAARLLDWLRSFVRRIWAAAQQLWRYAGGAAARRLRRAPLLAGRAR
jgi:uncharacterized protein (TIGR02611 family)